MTLTVLLVLLVVVAAIALFISEALSVDLVALILPVALLLLGILKPSEAFRGFSNEALITVAAMFVLSAGLSETRALARLGDIILARRGRSLPVLTLAFVVPVAAASAFINNTAAVAVFLPIALEVCRRLELAPSKLLIPLSYGAILGGMTTLIGTSTNLLVYSMAVERGHAGFTMFELGKVGLPLALMGIAYMAVFGTRLLPARPSLAALLPQMQHREFTAELLVLESSPLAGRKLGETAIGKSGQARVQSISRKDGVTISEPAPDVLVLAGDVIRLKGSGAEVIHLQSKLGAPEPSDEALGLRTIDATELVYIEGVVSPTSRLIGRRIGDLRLPTRYGVELVALHRHGRNLPRDLSAEILRFGDTLLLRGDRDTVQDLRFRHNFLLMYEIEPKQGRREKSLLALGVLCGVVLVAASGALPMVVAASTGALLMVLSGCLTMKDATDAIEWKVLFLIGGALSLGVAMEKSGLARILAELALGAVGPLGPVAVLSVCYLVTATLTEFLSNNAAAVLMVPIALEAAAGLHANPQPFLVAVAIAASASFATPIGYQTNTLVYGPGGYRFTDYTRVGLPLGILCWIVATIIIPLAWPL